MILAQKGGSNLHGRLLRGAVLAGLLLAVAPASRAGIRVQRTLDWRNGLPNSFTDQVEQDPAGFLWIATSSALVRYDGVETRAMSTQPVHFAPGSFRYGDPVLLVFDGPGLNRVTRLDGTPVIGADGRPLRASIAAITRDHALWAKTEAGLWRRSGEAWSGPIPLPGHSPLLYGPWPGSGDSVFVSTAEEILEIGARGKVLRSVAARGAILPVEGPGNVLYVLCWLRDGGHVLQARDGRVAEIEHSDARPMSMAMRGEVLWVAYDGKLVRIAPGEPNEEISVAQGYTGGGAVLVDSEGSLWIAGAHGLVQYSEPETASLGDRFPVGSRLLTPLRDGFWMSAWNSAVRGRRTRAGWELSLVKGFAFNPPCVGSDGAIWAVHNGFDRMDEHGTVRRYPAPLPTFGFQCLSDTAGFTWFPTAEGLYSLAPGAGRPVLSSIPPPSDSDASVAVAIAETREGEIWIGRTGEVCHSSAAALRAGSKTGWVCEPAGGGLPIYTLREMPSGDLWATGDGVGVMRRHAGRWESVPGAASLVSPVTYGPIPSPAGGFWIVGQGNCLRVEERPDLPEGWRVIEPIGLWQGLPTSWVMDLFEETDGTLWLATDMSLVRVPREARFARPAPPRIAIVEVSSDGTALDPGRSLDLPHDRNRLEVRFAALSYREPGLIRYRTRLHPEDPWSTPGRNSTFRFPDLPAGSYRIEAEATLDGEHWSPQSAVLDLEVLPPWWRTWWAYVAAVIGITSIAATAYRLRVGQLLRLERQRVRIAMDLHDAIGSGLGSIRLLAGLAGRDTTPERNRSELAARIASISEELATSLGDIVWSLRRGSGTLESLATQLLSRGAPLFEGQGADFRAEFPERWPDVRLSLAVRRHVFLIGLEAMHNAARHSGARAVVLGIDREGRRWRLRIEDDGHGIGDSGGSGRPGGGLGMESIARRASEIGAAARWEARPSGGTRFMLDFDATAEDRRTLDRTVSPERATGDPGDPVAHSPERSE